MLTENRIRKITFSILAIGFLLSLVQFLFNRSLWYDEALLALNINTKSNLELLNPLDNNQVAPVAFLQIEKFFSILAPGTECGLRVFPLLCFWASLFLFYKIAGLLLKNSLGVMFAVSLFCFNTNLIYYSSEVKQYMTDVFVCLFMYYLLLKTYRHARSRFYALALAGSGCFFISNISPIVLSVIALILIAECLQMKRYRLSLLFVFLTWLFSFCFYYVKFILGHPNRKAMLAYWEGSFLPSNVLSESFREFCFYKAKMVFADLLSFQNVIGIPAFLIVMIGIYGLFKTHNRKLLLLLLGPVVLHLFLSLLKLYPFDLRLLLYQSGLLILLLSIGAVYITDKLRIGINSNWLLLIPGVFTLSLCFYLFVNFPFQVEELRKSLKFVAGNSKPDESIYIYYGAVPAYKWYMLNGKFDFKNKLVFGNCYRGDDRKYCEEIRKIHGKCWIISSHLFNSELSYIRQSLDSVCIKKLSISRVGSEAFLVDFTSSLP